MKLPHKYIHDGFVNNDTLWAACIYSGGVYVFDVSDKSAIDLIGIQTTSASATHNCWVVMMENIYLLQMKSDSF
ncbi:MAG: hypothetical protein IPL12_21075 [Bacteroidetes bacterium]|nr:hypothetical protein [Bacteroidota bacterium]